MKPNFPASYILERNSKMFYLCQKHTEKELQIEGTKYIDTLPKNHSIPCLECSKERLDD